MRRLIGLATLTTLVVFIAVAQLVLPGIARDRVRKKVRGHGQIQSVDFHAFSAVELIWHHADKVSLQMASFNADATYLQKLLNQSTTLGSVRVSAGVLLTVRGATLTKTGNTLTATGEVRQSDIKAAVGDLIQNVVPVTSQDHQLILQGTVPLVGPINAVVTPHHGELTATPELGLLGSVFTVTLFDDPHLAINSVSANTNAGGFTVTLRARFR